MHVFCLFDVYNFDCIQWQIHIRNVCKYCSLFLTSTDNYPSIGYPCNPIALGQRWLAFSETKVSSSLTSTCNVIAFSSDKTVASFLGQNQCSVL